jgi:hypothetical protein
MLLGVVTEALMNRYALLPEGKYRSTITLSALLKVPSILPNCAVPVADDLNVMSRLPKSTTPSAPISIDFPAFTVKVPVPFTVKLPFTVKYTSSCGVPNGMA